MNIFMPLLVIFSLSFTNFCFAAITERVSITTDSMEADNDSFNATVSGNGNFVVFESDASNLVAGDTNGVMDIFVRDLAHRITTRVSINSAGEQSNGLSTNAVISFDGRYVVFESVASNLIADDSNDTTDIFLHDRNTGVTERISYSREFGEALMDSHSPSISADGRYIAYYSFANNLVVADNNDFGDIFVYDRAQAITERVSVNSNGNEANGDSFFPQLSAGGRYVSYASFADNLVLDDTNGRYDVFLFDRTTGSTERVSVTSTGEQADNHSFFSSVSDDGRYVAFESSAANLSPNDINRRSDVFLRDRLNQTTQRISLYSDGSSPLGASLSPKINNEGSFVVFSSVVDLLIDTDTNRREDVYLYNISDNTLELISVDSDDNLADFGSANPSISADGQRVAFQSMATNLVADDTNAREDTFIRDRAPNLPPVANAGQDINVYLGEQVMLDGSASFDPDGDVIVEYIWAIELAPAGSSATLSATDTVTTNLIPDMVGDYVVSLMVRDAVSTSIADEVFIRVIENLPPTAVINATPISGIAPLTVQFDGTNSSDPENGSLSYAWDFGVSGASSEDAAPVFTYTVPGTYSVLLTVEDSFGNIAEDMVEIVVTASNEPPSITPYTSTPAQGLAPLAVSFVANASDPNGDILSYFWDFGDGHNSTEENPDHVFYYPGSYTVKVQVTDGEFTASAQLYIAVNSRLTIKDIEAELDWEKRRHGSKLKLKIGFDGVEQLKDDDVVKVDFGELTLFKARFAEFKAKEAGVYIYKNRHVYVKLDTHNRYLKVSKRLNSSLVNFGQPIAVTLSLGKAMATDQVIVVLEDDSHYDSDKHQKRAKFSKRRSHQDHH
ncbi:PKD domain-containing protein [Kaarinaea lacus]